MDPEKRTIFKAVSSIAGAIIGAGIFTLPWAATQSGFLIFTLLLLLLVLVLILVHLMYAQVVLSTPMPHRFIGYVYYYFGRKAKFLVSLIIIFVSWGSLLVYLILGEKFLSFSFDFLPQLAALFIFFLLAVLGVYFDLKKISYLEVVGVLAIVLIVFGIFAFSINFSRSFPLFSANLSKTLVPYGLLLYALYGIGSIPEIISLTKKSKRLTKKVVILGTLLPALVYFLFVFSFLRIFPTEVISKEAIHSFNFFKNSSFYIFGKILGFFGFLTVLTSFWIFGLNLKDSFHFDFGLSKKMGWFLSCFIPLGLYFLKVNDFIKIISIVGAFGLGLESLVIIFLYKKVKEMEKEDEVLRKESILDIGNYLLFLIGLLLIFGAILEIVF